MARDIRSKHKVIRRFGELILDVQKNPLIKRNYQPGMHGSKGRSRVTEYGRQLLEKQKAKATYGILERQFSNYYKAAVSKKGNSAENLLHMLEARLDNVVYRMGLAQTRQQARQMVSHRHVLINGACVNVPSYQTEQNDVITVKEKAKKMLEARKTAVKRELPAWLSFDPKANEGRVVSEPTITLEQQPLNMQLIIEFYSR